ncbi:disulfide bond formation protein DsbB [Dyella sp. OK004]|uniref:disulfide bond formation protein B n=1 Tax=Dyella sp. OK004 TaxID=1855292 RepID=UPI0008F40E6E|nr:disulfide bond formation protein B [Dyella sp. OK004]SFS19622.1 disulfide bond formation protein DsbB [Dyella sp. OK004]
MNPFRWSYRVTYLVGFLICVGLLGFALYAEHVLAMIPCPLCVFQRIAFLFMAAFFLVGAIHGPRGKGGRWFYTAGVTLGALAGMATAARHLWLQTLPADQVPSCGPNLGYMMDAFPMAKVLKMVFTGSGECAKIEPILGMPMPAWTLLWFVLLAVLAIRAAASRRS